MILGMSQSKINGEIYLLCSQACFRSKKEKKNGTWIADVEDTTSDKPTFSHLSPKDGGYIYGNYRKGKIIGECHTYMQFFKLIIF